MRGVLVLLAAVVAGCSFDIDALRSGDGGGPVDGGRDAALQVDAGSIDAGAFDAGPTDGGSVDAGPAFDPPPMRARLASFDVRAAGRFGDGSEVLVGTSATGAARDGVVASGGGASWTRAIGSVADERLFAASIDADSAVAVGYFRGASDSSDDAFLVPFNGFDVSFPERFGDPSADERLFGVALTRARSEDYVVGQSTAGGVQRYLAGAPPMAVLITQRWVNRIRIGTGTDARLRSVAFAAGDSAVWAVGDQSTPNRGTVFQLDAVARVVGTRLVADPAGADIDLHDVLVETTGDLVVVGRIGTAGLRLSFDMLGNLTGSAELPGLPLRAVRAFDGEEWLLAAPAGATVVGRIVDGTFIGRSLDIAQGPDARPAFEVSATEIVLYATGTDCSAARVSQPVVSSAVTIEEPSGVDEDRMELSQGSTGEVVDTPATLTTCP
ncbi:MAG: hypothetical protein KC619_32980 [Myxococcales bacterium]|nr:hypothetical protein [Myxococcales bacterium]